MRHVWYIIRDILNVQVCGCTVFEVKEQSAQYHVTAEYLSRYVNVVETAWERGVLGAITLLRMRTDQMHVGAARPMSSQPRFIRPTTALGV